MAIDLCQTPDTNEITAALQLRQLLPRNAHIDIVAVRRRLSPNSLVVHGIDGSDYVMKLLQSGKAGAFFREALGCVLGSHLGLHMAAWKPLLLKPFILPAGLRLNAGEGQLFYGSRVPRPGTGLLEYLPSPWLRGTDAARQIVKMQVFDSWVANPVPRQYVAWRSAEGEPHIRFICNGSILSPMAYSRRAESVNPYLAAQRLQVEAEVVTEAVDAISGLLCMTLDRLMEQIPKVWISEADGYYALTLLHRRQGELLKSQREWLSVNSQARGSVQPLFTTEVANG